MIKIIVIWTCGVSRCVDGKEKLSLYIINGEEYLISLERANGRCEVNMWMFV